jgi:hypothetical protein
MMNERIKELLGQAYDEAVPETWTTLSSEQQGRVYEKFALLIVQECAEVCASIAAVRAGYNDADGRDTADSCGDQIKEHFGVE